MISTVGDLKKALEELNDDDELVVFVRGERKRFPNLQQAVGYDGSWGPNFLYYHGEPQDEEPLKVWVVLGDSLSTESNEQIAKSRGVHFTVDEVRSMVQLDPRPWVYRDPVSKQKTRLTKPIPGVLTKFKPRYGYADLEELYS